MESNGCYNSLKGPQRLSLRDWWRKEAPGLQEKRLTLSQIAGLASNELGFRVTGANISGAVRDTGIKHKLPPPPKQTPLYLEDPSEYVRILMRLEAIERDIRVITQSWVDHGREHERIRAHIEAQKKLNEAWLSKSP